ncbi:helix-turn-helix domain-containing protein [Paraburkholderia sp. D15]|uniref:helix-turn-helix domain-containing protein n=1 Tax=Paraburkholderia sp. D15 TaxID=2880218 RepID=UPI0024785670|nr:helix-turn-helix domain-containing protein [Paraburkholderia sp. D15]WGS50838.1 helix-turn-helix domain-containing protein [Paraburkholderia sp. D15]
MTESDLPSTTKLVLFVIAEYANAMDDICWPSIGTIAGKASLSERCVSNHLAVAESNGWLTRWRSRRPARRWAHAHYRLSVPKEIALRQRDVIDFDLAAGGQEPDSDVAESFGNSEQRSGVAHKTGNHERRSGDSAASPERRSGETSERAAGDAQDAEDSQSYLNHVPTSKPVNRSTYKNLSNPQPTVVNEAIAGQREDFSESQWQGQAGEVAHEAVQNVADEEGTAESLAAWMLERIRVRLPDFGTPDMPAWVAEIRQMLQVDGRGARHIAGLFGWADRDRFWSKVMVSPARLRKNWDEIRRRRNDALALKAAPGGASAAGASAQADDRQCAHVEDGCRCTRTATTIIGAGSSRRGYCRAHIGQYED